MKKSCLGKLQEWRKLFIVYFAFDTAEVFSINVVSFHVEFLQCIVLAMEYCWKA